MQQHFTFPNTEKDIDTNSADCLSLNNKADATSDIDEESKDFGSKLQLQEKV
jgi:hypothetical protein